jgi:cytosine deaminase
VIEARGLLVSAPFVDVHFHMTRPSLGLPRMNESGTCWRDRALSSSPADAGGRDRAGASLYCDLAVSRASPSAPTWTCATTGCSRRRRALEVSGASPPTLDLQLVAFSAGRLHRSPGAGEPDGGRSTGAWTLWAASRTRAHHGGTGRPPCGRSARSRRAGLMSTCTATRPTTRCPPRGDLVRRATRSCRGGSHLTSMHSMTLLRLEAPAPRWRSRCRGDSQPADHHRDPGPARHYQARGMTHSRDAPPRHSCATSSADDCVMDPWYSLGPGWDMLEAATWRSTWGPHDEPGRPCGSRLRRHRGPARDPWGSTIRPGALPPRRPRPAPCPLPHGGDPG